MSKLVKQIALYAFLYKQGFYMMMKK